VLGEKRLAELSPRDMYAWRFSVPEGHRFEATQALRQVLNRAVCWGLLDYNPAKRGVANPARRAREKRPFETWTQVEAVAAQLGPVYGPMVIFAAATGLRPSELFGLDRRDVDRQLGVVYVRRAYANGRLKHTKTRLSTRAATGEGPRSSRPAARLGQPDPLSERARRPDRLPDLRTQALAAGTDQGRDRAGPWPLRPATHLRHLRSPRRRDVFAVSRFMGTSIAMIDRHYGHLANDSRDHAVALLDALALERTVDAARTSHQRPAKPPNQTNPRPRRRRTRRVVDARWTPRIVSVASTDD
jgi:integrase